MISFAKIAALALTPTLALAQAPAAPPPEMSPPTTTAPPPQSPAFVPAGSNTARPT
jgi:hypothetical protein